MRRAGLLICGVVALLAVLLASFTGSASRPAAASVSSCTTPPAVFPEDQITPGLLANGRTVLSGTTPSWFGVKVLGVLNDGIAPGLDLIVVKLSGPVVKQGGGAFEGISGSPVYVNGKLLGAVSYALSYDRTVAGLTPAQPMVDLFGYGSDAATAPAMAPKVALTPRLSRTVASATGSATTTSGTMTLLRMPVSVSGLSDTGLQKLQHVFDRYSMGFTAVHGGSAAIPNGVSGPAIEAGGNFAATQSFGDLTFYGLGTATAVCGDEVVAFGHPFFLNGPTSLGMNNADTITIVNDPFYPYKLANITGFQGMVDQDRLAGIRGTTGETPPLTDITTDITNSDLGRSHSGETTVADQTLMALIAQYDLYVEDIATFDREGAGSETMSWTIQGTYQGEPFTLTRTGIAYSPYDINYEAGYELTGELGAFQSNIYGPVTVNSVQFTGAVTERDLTARIGKIESKSRVQPGWAVRRYLLVRRGGTAHLRITLKLADGTTTQVVTTVAVPRGFRSGPIELRGGNPPRGCLYCAFGGTLRNHPKTFAGLLAQFQNGEHASDLIVQLGGRKARTVPTENVISGRKLLYLIAVR
jgi:hypothetical protein